MVAIAWSGGDLLVRQGFQFAALLVLARFLAPADFGAIAIVAAIVAIGAVLADGGLAYSLIQRQNTSDVDASSVFWINLIIGAAISVAIASQAPWIAIVFGLPILESITPFMSFVILFGAMGSVHVALLTKRMDFRTQAKAGGMSAAIGSAVAIALAVTDHGVWSLVVQTIVSSALNCLLLWALHQWRPSLALSAQSVRKLGSFGVYHLASSLMDALYTRLYALLLGRGYGPVQVGMYRNADAICQMPVNFLGGVVGRVAFSALSTISSDPRRMRDGVKMGARSMMLINAPLMLGGAVFAEPLVQVLLGVQWQPAAEIMRVLCIAALLYPLHLLNLQALMAQGHAKLMFGVELAKKIFGLTVLLLAVRHGAVGLAWAQVVYSFVALLANTHYTKRFLGYGLFQQLRDCLPMTLVAGLAAAIAYYLGDMWLLKSPLTQVLVFGGIMGSVYIAMLVMTGTYSWRELTAAAGIGGSRN